MRWPNRKTKCVPGPSSALLRLTLRFLRPGVLILAATMANAQSELSDFQNWYELDVSARVSQNVDVSWVSQGRLSTNFSNPAKYLTGANLKIRVGRDFELTPSYYYLGLVSVSDHRGHFHVPMLAATIRKNWVRLTLADRNRFVGAIGGGNDFWIYVNRPRVDWRVGASSTGTTLFAWDEAFYFSLFHGWTRNRFAAGMRKEFGERWAADAYYLRQDDSRIQPRDLNGLGITVEIRLR